MPAASTILDTVYRSATELAWLAIGWHFVLVAIGLALLRRGIPTRALTGLLVGLAASVALVSAAYNSLFNMTSFALLALLLLLFGQEMTPVRTTRLVRYSGAALVVFGATYAHFTEPWYRALYAAPIGIAPCPTLAVLAGITMLGGGFGLRGLPAVLAMWTAFYGLFGIFRLGVIVDVGLLVAAAGLSALATVTRATADTLRA